MIVFDKEPAYVLHSRPYRETNSLVQFLTAQHGRITTVSRSSSGASGKSIQPFIPALLCCSGRSELLNLREFDPQGKAILTHPEDQMVGMYINELVVRLIPARIASRRLFKYYAAALSNVTRQEYEPVLRKFELQLLEIAGYGLQLEYDSTTSEPLLADAVYRYAPGEGPVRCTQPRLDECLCRGETLLNLHKGMPDKNSRTLREAKRLLRTVINYHLKGRKIHTRSVFRYLHGIT